MKGLFRRNKVPPTREPTTHDWTRRDYAFNPQDGGLRGSVVAWGGTPRTGDYLILRNGSGSTRYRVTDVRTPLAADADVFTAYLTFAPRVS